MNIRRKQILLGFMITCLLASPAAVAGADWNMFHENAQRTGYLDQHLPLGEGTLDLRLINGVKRGIIELNNYDDVIKSRNVLVENSK